MQKLQKQIDSEECLIYITYTECNEKELFFKEACKVLRAITRRVLNLRYPNPTGLPSAKNNLT